MKIRKLLAIFLFFTFSAFCQSESTNQTDSAGQKQGYWKKSKEYNGRYYLGEEGSYLNNKKEGLWTEYYPSGKLKNKIEYKEGRPNGKAIMYYENGQIDETGVWIKNRWIGVYIKYYESGQVHWKFNFNENGRREGYQAYYDEAGKVICEGNFVDGKPENLKSCCFEVNKEFDGRDKCIKEPVIYYNKERKVSHIVYKDSLEIWYHPNGNRKHSVEYKKGKLNGEEIWYYENEELKTKLTYKDGQRNGPVEFYYETGKLAYKGTYKDGKMSGPRTCYDGNGNLMNGTFVLYHKNGQKEREVYCKNGKPEGEMRLFSESGEPVMYVYFKDGKPHGMKYYLYNGQKTGIELYNNGEFTGNRAE